MAIQAAAVAVGKAVGAQVGEALLGSLLSAIGLGDSTGEDLVEVAKMELAVAEATLAEEQVQTELAQQNVELAKQSLEVLEKQLETLNEISESLTQINTQLEDVNVRLGAIQQALYEQFHQSAEQHTYHTWYNLHDKLYELDPIINGALSDFTSFITPIEKQITVDGATKTITRFPIVSAETKDSFIETVINSPNSVSKQISAIDGLIQGIGGTPGILELYADLVVYDIIYPSEEQIESLAPGSAAYSNLLSRSVGRLVDYHSYLLTLQLKAILLELEVRQFVGDETANNKWEQYLKNVKRQEKTFFKALWRIVKHWLINIEATFPGQFFQTRNLDGALSEIPDNDHKIFSETDKSLFGTLLRGNHINNSFIPFPKVPTWLESAEELLDAFSRINPKLHKIVVHGFAFSGIPHIDGMHLVVADMQDVTAKNTLMVDSNDPVRFARFQQFNDITDWSTDLYLSGNKSGTSSFAWIRQEIPFNSNRGALDNDWEVVANNEEVNNKRIIDYGYHSVELDHKFFNEFFKVFIPWKANPPTITFEPRSSIRREAITYFIFNAYSKIDQDRHSSLPISWPESLRDTHDV